MRYTHACCLLLLATATAPAAALGQAAPDTTASDTLSFDRIDGARLRALPIDSLDEALRFLPGFTAGESFRGAPAPSSIYIDGVPMRRLLPGSGVVPALTALRQIQVLHAGAPVSRADATGGVVELHTAGPASDHFIEAGFGTDRFAPADWRRSRTSVDLRAGGSVPGIAGLGFTIAGEALGSRYTALPQGFSDIPVYVISGVDSIIALEISGGDSTAVALPAFAEWTGTAVPLGNSDRSSLSAALGYSPDGAEWTVDLSLHTTRRTSLSKRFEDLYNPEAWAGSTDRSTALSLTAAAPLGPFTTKVYLSHQRYDVTAGDVDPLWANANSHPAFGFSSAPHFFADADDYPVDARIAHESRTHRLSTDPMLDDYRRIRGPWIPGVAQPLRLNPYGMRSGWSSAGVGTASTGFAWRQERRVLAGAAATLHAGVHALQVGAEHDAASLRGRDANMFSTAFTPVVLNDPSRTALWIEDAVTTGSLFLRAGVRAERVDRGGLVTTAPGFVAVMDTSGIFHPTSISTTLSPRVSAMYRLGGRTSANVSVGRFYDSRATYGPLHDPALALQDFSSQGGTGVYTADVTAPFSDVAEVRFGTEVLGGLGLGAAVYMARTHDAYALMRSVVEQPGTGMTVFVPVWTNDTETSEQRGLELSARGQIAPGFAASVTYEMQFGDEPVRRPHSAAAIFAFEPAVTGGVLGHLGIYATASFRSGIPYTRLVNRGDGQLSGEPLFSGQPAEPINSSRTAGEKRFDLRAVKGFMVGGHTISLTADVRNPLGLENTNTVYAETGTTSNEFYRDIRRAGFLVSYLGTGSIADQVIDDLGENALNRYALHRAEQRFGNGDGVFTTEEQGNVADAYLNLTEGPQWRTGSDRTLRLGVEVKW